MKKYFLHNGTDNIGPFDLEELKKEKITKETPIWYEGIEDWTTAGEVKELEVILFSTPLTIPPLKTIPPPIQKSEGKEKVIEDPQTIFGLKKNVFYIVLGIITLVFFTFIFNLIQENKSAKLKQQNSIIERENQQYIIQQQEIEAQKKIIEEKERLEAERIVQVQKQKMLDRKIEIEKLIIDYTNRLEEEEKNLAKVKGFVLFRTTAERNEDISLVESNIEYWKTEIQKLNNETRQINQELLNIK